MTVTLPDSLGAWIEKQAAISGYVSTDAFVETVLRAEQKRTHTKTELILVDASASGAPSDGNASYRAERQHVLQERLRRHTQKFAR